MNREYLSDLASQANSRNDFIEFVEALKNDYLGDRERWQSWTVPDYLEAMEAYVGSAIKSPFDETDFSPSWSLFAHLLLIASVYE
jgi:hypothetical protein